MRRTVAALLAISLAACGDASASLQIVRGRLVPDGLALAPLEVHAIRNGAVVAAASLQHDGSFVIGLAPGEPVVLAFVDTSGEPAAWLLGEGFAAAELRICTPAEPFELGALVTRPGLCRRSGACSTALSLRQECLHVAALGCSALEPALTECLQAWDDACATSQDKLDDCLDFHGGDVGEDVCVRERYLASTCDGARSCEELSLSYWTRCGFPCDGLEALVGRVCPPCERSDLVVADHPPPPAFDCEPER